MCLRSRADNEHIARIESAIEAAVKQNAIDEPAQAQADGYQSNSFQHNATGNISRSDQVERPGKQQPGSKAGLGADPLLVEEVGHVHRRIEMQTPAGNDQRAGEAAQAGPAKSTLTGRETCAVKKAFARLPQGWRGTDKA